MPWHVEHKKGEARPYKIVQSDTGKVVGSSTSSKEAESSIRARYANSPEARKKAK